MSEHEQHPPRGSVRSLAEAPEQRWEDERGSLTYRTVFGGDASTSQLVLGRCVVPPDGGLEHHSHPATEVYHVLSGRGRLLLGREVHLVRAGDSVFIPGGTPHSVHTEGAEALEFVYVYAADAADGPDTAYTMHEPSPPLG